jgi:hypothetical protein
MKKVPGDRPYNRGRWRGQDAPLIDTEQLKEAHQNFNKLWAQGRAKRPGRRMKSCAKIK